MGDVEWWWYCEADDMMLWISLFIFTGNDSTCSCDIVQSHRPSFYVCVSMWCTGKM